MFTDLKFIFWELTTIWFTEKDDLSLERSFGYATEHSSNRMKT